MCYSASEVSAAEHRELDQAVGRGEGRGDDPSAHTMDEEPERARVLHLQWSHVEH